MIADRLKDRAVRDVLNSITVSRDLVNYRVVRPMTRRIVDVLSGEDRRIAELIDSNHSHSIDSLLELTTVLSDRLAFSDETQLKVIRRLKEVLRTLDSQGLQTRQMALHIDHMEERFNENIKLLVERADARDSIEHGYYSLKSKIDSGMFSLLDLWQFVDELWWGSFGLIQRRSDQQELAARLRSEIVLRLLELFKVHFGTKGVIELRAVIAQVPALSVDEVEVFDLLALDPQWQTRPLTRAIYDRSRGDVDEVREAESIAVITTAERIGEQLFDEAKRAGRA